MAVSKEVRDGLFTLNLPFVDVMFPDVALDPNGSPAPTDEQDIEYNAECTRLIVQHLKAVRKENNERIASLERGEGGRIPEEERTKLIEELRTPMIRTRYPSDDFDSEDVVTLDRDDNVVVLDAGSR